MVSVVVILLLAGCQRSDQKGPAKTAIQSGKEPADIPVYLTASAEFLNILFKDSAKSK